MQNNITEADFPILACLTNNIMSDALSVMLDDSGFDDKGCASIQKSFPFFVGKSILINFLTSPVHNALLQTGDFKAYQELLKGSQEHTGLLLLPETLLPDFSNVPEYVEVDPNDYPIDSILYSWLSTDNHDAIGHTLGLDEPWHQPDDRMLMIIPFCSNRITQATDQYHMASNEEIYGWEWSDREGRAWYGKIHDYVMSYLILDGLRKQPDSGYPRKTINYKMEFVDHRYGNTIKVLKFLG